MTFSYNVYASNDDGHNHGRVCVILMCPDRKKIKKKKRLLIYIRIIYRYVVTRASACMRVCACVCACMYVMLPGPAAAAFRVTRDHYYYLSKS